MESIRVLVAQHLGRKIEARALLANILAVDCGIKPAYLFDIGMPDASKLAGLLEDLAKKGFLENILNIVKLGMDCCIVNVSEVRKISSLKTIFIDISAKIHKPTVLSDDDKLSKILVEFSDLISCLDNSKVKVITYNIKDGDYSVPIPSLFGCFLGYPVVYWYDTSTGEDENCLSCEKLTVTMVTARMKPKEKHIDLFKDNYVHILYQFSYPEELSMNCAPVVSVWTNDIKEKINKSEWFTDSCITVTEKTLETVCL